MHDSVNTTVSTKTFGKQARKAARTVLHRSKSIGVKYHTKLCVSAAERVSLRLYMLNNNTILYVCFGDWRKMKPCFTLGRPVVILQ